MWASVLRFFFRYRVARKRSQLNGLLRALGERHLDAFALEGFAEFFVLDGARFDVLERNRSARAFVFFGTSVTTAPGIGSPLSLWTTPVTTAAGPPITTSS